MVNKLCATGRIKAFSDNNMYMRRISYCVANKNSTQYTLGRPPVTLVIEETIL